MKRSAAEITADRMFLTLLAKARKVDGRWGTILIAMTMIAQFLVRMTVRTVDRTHRQVQAHHKNNHQLTR